VDALGGAFCKNFWACMQPHNNCRACISRLIKHRSILLSHYNSTGTSNDRTSGSYQALPQHFRFQFSKSIFARFSEYFSNRPSVTCFDQLVCIKQFDTAMFGK
jgi:hypothetical protein